MIETGMKDKLSHLVEHWERHYLYGGAMEYMQCANELLAILDAEGDGGALLDALDHRNLCHASGKPEWPQNCDCPKHAHPERSGVVSDEDVDSACDAYASCGEHYVMPRIDRMRAALESYERNRK